MSVPPVQRLPVTSEDLKEIAIPSDLTHYLYECRFDREDYRLLQLGLMEEEIAYVEAGWLYYFCRAQPYKFNYKLRLVDDDERVFATEMWADPGLSARYISGGTLERELNRALNDIRKREHPAHLGLYRRQPEVMDGFNTYPMDVELTRQEAWKLMWGFVPRSMDDHWRSWFDFETQRLHVYWYWKPHHLYQIRFEEFNEGYRAVEVRIATKFDNAAFNVEHAKGILRLLIRLCPYRFRTV